MKSKFLLLASMVLGFAAAAFFTACAGPVKEKTLSDVLKDIPAESYTLNFQDLGKDEILTQSNYGSLSAETLADIDEICPPLKKIGYKKIPRIVVWPPVIVNTLIPPPVIVRTCPTMIPLKYKDMVLQTIAKSKWQFAKEINSVQAGDYAVLASKDVLSAFNNIRADSMDMAGMTGVDLNRVFVLTPESGEGMFFGRSWYGQANLAEAGLSFARLKDIFPPKQVGCFDPEQLRLLRENLVKANKMQFEALKLQEIAGTQSAMLTF